MTRVSTYSFCKVVSFPLLFILLFASCTKDPETPLSPFPPSTPPTSTPTGVIDNFEMVDSLVGYNYGTIAKWLVSGTNTYTTVTFNGIKVATTGTLATGPLKVTTKYTLAVNNGKQNEITVLVADSTTTYLWHGGKFFRKTKSELETAAGVYTDTLIDPYIADQRIYFSLKGTSKIIQGTSNANVSQQDAGPYVVQVSTGAPGDLGSFTWRGIVYKILFIDSRFLKVEYIATHPTRGYAHYRDTYQFE